MFCARIVQNVVLDRVSVGLDALHVYRFQALGVVDDIIPPTVSPLILEILKNPSHPSRAPGSDGPLVFVRENECTEVSQPAALLLHPDRRIRESTLEYLMRGGFSPDPWLTPRTVALLEARSGDCKSDELQRWRAAGIELVPVVRDDLFAHLAGLCQSLAAHYEEGVDEYLNRVMRPSLGTLLHLRPPLWCPSQQRAEVDTWLTAFAQLPTLSECLTAYVNHCGYVPLCEGMSSAEVVRRWNAKHLETAANWDAIWSWAHAFGTPLADFHACAIALGVPSATPVASMSQFCNKVIQFLDTGEIDGTPSSLTASWRLYYELGVHFTHHVEALHPGQDGERVACYAWWLADKVARLLGKSERQAVGALDRMVRPEADLSHWRWTVARSPTTPSSVRHGTLFDKSIWATSFLTQLSRGESVLRASDLTEELYLAIGHILRRCIIAEPLACLTETATPVFAFEENSELATLLRKEEYGSAFDRGTLRAILQFHRDMTDPAVLQRRLEQLLSLPSYEQDLVLVFLKGATSLTSNFDDAVSGWLVNTSAVVKAVEGITDFQLELVLMALGEYQQRVPPECAARLPHMMAHAIEQGSNAERVRVLFFHILLMSINAGIVSPIQRALTSRWRMEFIDTTRIWRDNLVEVARYSEPWVAARVRSMSAVISRIIGPKLFDVSAADPDEAATS